MSADIKLQWEWPADRTPEQKILVQIESIKSQGDGFFGVFKSPSLADNMPDAQIINGVILNPDSSLNGKSITLIAPKLEIETIKKGGFAIMGLVNNSTCICIAPIDSADTDLTKINCP